jgi:c-di-GMP-related signal transduction protein
VASLPLADDVRAALLHGEGTLGAILATAQAIESGDVEDLDLVVGAGTASAAHAEAIIWTEELRATAGDVPTKRRPFGTRNAPNQLGINAGSA